MSSAGRGERKTYSVAHPPGRESPQLKCSFCGKAEDKVRGLVRAGITDVAICDECVKLCLDIFEQR